MDVSERKPFKAISVMLDDYEFFEQVRQIWVDKNKVDISMPQALKLGMLELKTQLDK